MSLFAPNTARSSLGFCILALNFCLSIPSTSAEESNISNCFSRYKAGILQENLSFLSGDRELDRWVEQSDKLSPYAIPINLKSKKNVWLLHKGMRDPYTLKFEVVYSDGEKTKEISYVLSQNKSVEAFFALKLETTSTRFGTNRQEKISISQSWDIDQSCIPTATGASVTRVEHKNGQLTLHNQSFSQGGQIPSKTTNAKVNDPKDGELIIKYLEKLNNSDDLTRFASKYQGKTLYFPGTPEVHFLSMNDFKRVPDTVHWDPILNRDNNFSGIQYKINVGYYSLESAVRFSSGSPFGYSSDPDGEEEWRIPEEFWSRGEIKSLKHESSISFEKSKRVPPGEEVKVISVNSALPITFSNLNPYWQVLPSIGSSTIGADGKQSFNILLSLKTPIFFSKMKATPLWRASSSRPYVQDSAYVQSNIPEIQAMAREAMADLPAKAGAPLIAASIVKVLKKYFTYDYRRLETDGKIEEMTTSELVRLKSGTCQNFSVLFAAIARSLGIPTRIIAGLMIGERSSEWHAWNELEVSPGLWLPIEPQAYPAIFRPNNYLPVVVEDQDSYSTPEIQTTMQNLKPEVTLVFTQPFKF